MDDLIMRLLGQQSRNQVGVLILVLVAKSAPHISTHNPNLMVRETEIARCVMATVGDTLGRRIQRELVALPVGETSTALHLGIMHKRS